MTIITNDLSELQFLQRKSTEESPQAMIYRSNRSFVFGFFLAILIFIYLFIYLWLCWVFVPVQGLSPAAAGGGHSSSQRAGLSLSRPLPPRSTGSAIAAHGPSRSAACGIFPDQGSNLRPLHRQADPQPLRHQGSPATEVLTEKTDV